jgi:hypothetical protein
MEVGEENQGISCVALRTKILAYHIFEVNEKDRRK